MTIDVLSRATGSPIRRRRRALIGLVSVSLLLLLPRCATRSARGDSIPAEIVDSREARTLGGDSQYYLTLNYRDRKGASCTTTVEVDQITWMRLKTKYEPCLVPYRDHYVVSACE